MITLVLEEFEEKLYKRFDYTLKLLLNIAGISFENNISIYYGGKIDSKYDICILKNKSNKYKQTDKTIVIEEDILDKTFKLVVCKDEINGPKDHRGRFLAEYSKVNYSIPHVNYYANSLKKYIHKLGKVKNITIIEEQRKFTVALSHDVDNINDKNIYVTLHRLKLLFILLFKEKDIKKSLTQIRLIIYRLLSRKKYRCFFDEFMEIESKYGFKSSFYFMTGDKGRYGARYKLDKIKNTLIKLKDNGWEIGLHTNYYSYNKLEKIEKEKKEVSEVINEEIIGCRNHYLRFEVPKTWNYLMKAGFKYDTTLGYSDAMGFRAGIAYPFYPYDINEDKIIDILEIPLVIMDCTILDETKYHEEAWSNIKQILDEVKNVNGIIAINFHHTSLDTVTCKLWREVYIKILDYIYKNNGQGVTCKTVYKNHKVMKEGYYHV